MPVLPVALCSRFPQQGEIIRELVWAEVSQKHFGFEGGQDHRAWKEIVLEPVSACVCLCHCDPYSTVSLFGLQDLICDSV